MMNQHERNVVLIVGATGSLGKSVVAEFQRRGTRLRLVGRSLESFEQAGFRSDEKTAITGGECTQKMELIVCKDVTDRNAWSDRWFRDVKLAVCVARPRALKARDYVSYTAMIQNLSDLVCANSVPNLMMLGRPYVEEYPFGMTPSMLVVQCAEKQARERFRVTDSSRLTIVRIAEMSEFGYLLELARITRIWFCVWGKEPKLQPMSARDFATAVAVYAKQDANMPELLIGGPQVLTWSELGASISEALGKQLFIISVPMIFFKVWIGVLCLAKSLLPFLEGFENILKVMSIPMIANCTNDDFECIGDDRLDAFLRAHAVAGHATWKKRIFMSWNRAAKPKNE